MMKIRDKVKYKAIILLLTLLLINMIFCLTSCSYSLEKSVESVLEISVYDNENNLINQGTGFCVKDSFIIVSVAHLFEYVIEYDYKIIATNLSNENYPLELVFSDVENDIAVLKTIKGLNPLILEDEQPNNLEDIYMIGNTREYGLVFNKGIVSLREKTLFINGTEKKVMQTNITINPGDSGAPVLNKNGHVVGMMSFRLTDGNGQSVDGVSFSVLLEHIQKALGA